MSLICGWTLGHADILGLHGGSLLDGWGDYLGGDCGDWLDDLGGGIVEVVVAVLAWGLLLMVVVSVFHHLGRGLMLLLG